MSLRIFSVLSQNLLSQGRKKKEESKRNERIWCKLELVGGGRKAQNKMQ